MANPPFNLSDWNDGSLNDDPRWKYGLPPVNNANFAWLQHMIQLEVRGVNLLETVLPLSLLSG
jgi:type I restriction-modification system DNA methylase subunit